jgi:hypothetical protein
MRSFFLLATFAAFILFGTSGFAFADDVDHFRQFEVPRDEARILALTGVREFRCDYESTPCPSPLKNRDGSEVTYQENFNLFAELYEGTTCVGRYRLAVAVNAFNDLKAPLKGIFSFGWNQEKHQLISVIDNQQFYSPWTASLVLKDFSSVDHFFFENSTPEKRHSITGTADFNIYPVVGICGERRLKMNEIGFKDAISFLQVCGGARAKNALVIYLYKSSFGEEAPLQFNPSP